MVLEISLVFQYFDQGLPIAGTEPLQLTATAVYLKCYPPTESDNASDQAGSDEYGQNEYYEWQGEPPAEEFYYAG